jgi:hypothetical protein
MTTEPQLLHLHAQVKGSLPALCGGCTVYWRQRSDNGVPIRNCVTTDKPSLRAVLCRFVRRSGPSLSTCVQANNRLERFVDESALSRKRPEHDKDG